VLSTHSGLSQVATPLAAAERQYSLCHLVSAINAAPSVAVISINGLVELSFWIDSLQSEELFFPGIVYELITVNSHHYRKP
jgi:uncharacterized membrane protein YqaE (UPF0057 family)